MASKKSKRGTDAKEFQVESILAKRERGGHVEYLLKWKDCAEKDNSWEPENNLNCSDLLNLFKEQQCEIEERTGKAEAILGAARMNSEIFYLVKRRGIAAAEFVPSRIASRSFSQLIIDFYEKRYANIR